MTGEQVKAWRESRDMTQEQLGRALGYDGEYAAQPVGNWERGRSKPQPYLRLALERLGQDTTTE